MEYGSSIPQSAENGFQMQDSWIPVTPLKPEQTNRLARMQWLNPGVCVDGVNPGAYSDRLIQDTICQRAVVPSNSISPAAVQFHNVAVADRMPDLNGWRAAAFATQTQVTSLNSYMEALQNAEARWNKMQYAHFLASKDAAATAAATVGQGGSNVARLQPPISYLQTDGCINQQQHSHPAVNLLCMNQVLQGSNPTSSRNTVCQPQMPQYGFPVPYHATYNHNPPTKALSDVVTDGILSFQPDPPTPDRSWRVRTRQPVETIGPFGNARGSHEKENADSPQRGAGISAQANGSIRPDQVLLQLIESSQPAVPSTSIKETPKGNAVFQSSASTGARAYGSIRPSGDQVLLQLMDPSEADVLSTPIKEIPKVNGLNTGANGSIRSYSDQVLLQLIDSSPPSVPLTPNKEIPKGSTDDLQPSVGIGTRANGSIRPYSDQVLLQRMDSLHSTIPSTPVKVMPKNNAGSLQPGVGINAQANGCIRPYSDHVLLQRIDSSQAALPLSQIKEIPNGNADSLQPSVSISAQASGSIRPYSAQVSVQQMDLLQSAVPSTTIREIPKSGADGLQHSISISAQANGSIRSYSDQDQWQAIDSLQPSVPSTPIKQIPRNAEDLQPSGSISTQANGSIKPSSNQILFQPIDSLQPTVPSTPTKEIPNLSYKECLGKISLPTTPSNPVSLNHNKDEHGIDLNKTPQQKPKRKKHRPKVIKEGTAKRTPKPVTPNQAINAEKPPGKRKYVRKAGLKASVAPTSDAKKALNSEDGMATKSCRRALNFNLEDKAQDGHLGMIQVHQDIPSSSTCDKSVASFRMAVGLDVNCDQRTGTNHMLASKSTPQVPQGLEVMMNSPTGIPFDLNHSMNQINDEYSSLLQNVNSCQQPSREQMKDFAMKNYMGFLGTQMNIHHSGHPTQMNQNIQLKETGHRINLTNAASDNRPSTGPSNFQNGIQSINEINGNSHAPSVESSQAKRASKRERSHVDAHQRPINLFVRHTLASQCLQRTIQRDEHNGKGSSEDMHFSVNCKKMKADMKHDELKLNEVPSASIRNGSSSVRDVANQFRSSQTTNRSLPPSNLTNRSKKQQNGTSNIVCDTYPESMAGKQYQTGSNIFRETFSHLNAQNGNDLNTIQAPKSSMGFHNIDRKTMGRSDRPVQMDDLTSITTASIEHRHQPQAPIKAALTHKERQVSNSFSKPHAQVGILVEENYAHKVHPMTSMSWSSTNQVHLQGHKADTHIYHQTSMKSRGTPHVQKPSGLAPSSYCNSKSYNQLILGASCPSQVSAPNSDPVDEIVYKLDKLNINCSNNIIRGQAERALVPYAAEGKIVPYRGRFDPTKKRHPRPKVDLDPETDRVWKLLMWKESSDGTEGMDADKEKWWEEERRVFRGRADSFIARMHLVQGDRRFSPWKGSVVDSVVGVFLTQNVSDHLSSSAFMALAARFPLQSISAKHNEGKSRAAEEKDASILYPDDSNQQIKVPSHMVFDTVSMTTNEVEPFKEMGSTNEFFGSNKSICIKDCSEGKHLVACQIGSPENKTEIAFTVTESASLMDPQDRRTMEAVVSPQSFISSQNSTESMVTFRAADRIGLSSDSNSEAEDLMNRLEYNDINSFTPFMELLQMEGANTFKEFFVNGNGNIPYKKNLDAAQREYDKKKQLIGAECWQGSYPSINDTHSNHPQAQLVFSGIESNDSNNHLHTGLVSRPVEFLSVDASGEGSRSSLPSTGSEITEIRNCSYTGKRTNIEAEKDKFVVQGKSFSNVQTALAADSCTPCKHPSTTLDAKVYTDFDTSEGSTLMESQTATMRNRTEPNPKGDLSSSKNGPAETGKRGMTKAEKGRAFDWDSLRKQAQCNGPKKERSRSTMDSVDWEAIRCADVKEISNTIRERGMNNMLSERIKDFLNRLVREHGSIDLEWLRDVPPDKVKDYLLSIRGLGLKSVECVRLLTLHHLAFPVDTNVGRICVRLGWVPIQPLPESLQLHLLELYPMLETIQKYLWPRLCKLDQRTLYELHYQMITFGKVFCTKSKPNCNACPMRGECKHFASAFASARLALPGPEEKGLVSSAVPVATEQGYKLVINTTLLPPLEQNPRSHVGSGIKQCEPIIEEPATPEPECVDSSESAIEDAFWTEDPDEIPTIRLNLEEFSQNVHNYMQESSEHQDCDMSKALVVLTQEAASIPMPKLKNVSRLRTEHQVYELPDSHPLLAGWDQREPDDPCSYLLAIWTPGETAQSTEPPEICCASQNSGNLCSKKTCFTCNSTRETNAQTVRGTILIPCRTAMRGSFPLNGTYFQVNEVFADHDTSLQPIDIPRAWVWNLPRRTVYFGTSIPTIFKGLTTEEIQQCFWRGFVCVRGFDQKSRAPRPLVARLHFPASKLVRTKKTTAELA